MTDRVSLRSLAAAFSFLALAGCGRSKDEGALTPVPAASSMSVAAASTTPTPTPAPAPAADSPVPVAKPEPESPVPAGVDARKPVATVNGKPISAEKVYSVYRMNQQALEQRGRVLSGNDAQALRAQSLEAVVAEELLYQAAVAKGLTAPPSEVEAVLTQFKTRIGAGDKYEAFLAKNRLTDAEVRREIARNIVTEAYGKGLTAGKGVTEDLAKKFYDDNAPKGMFNVPEQVHVQYILVKASDKDPESVRVEAKNRAEAVAKRAAAGEDFGELAKQYSQDPTAARGGDVGFVPRGMMFPKFEEVVFAARPGDVTPVFETPKGFNVVKVLGRKPEATRPFDEVKSELMADMGRVMEQEVIKSKVRELASGAQIAILDPAFAPPGPDAAPAVAAKP